MVKNYGMVTFVFVLFRQLFVLRSCVIRVLALIYVQLIKLDKKKCLVSLQKRLYTTILVTEDEGDCNLEKEVISTESIKFDFS